MPHIILLRIDVLYNDICLLEKEIVRLKKVSGEKGWNENMEVFLVCGRKGIDMC